MKRRSLVKTAPHSTRVSRLDEVQAARKAHPALETDCGRSRAARFAPLAKPVVIRGFPSFRQKKAKGWGTELLCDNQPRCAS
jgi:hypothetical protein